MADYQKEIIKLIKQAAYSHDIYQIFNDWLEMSAISISNSLDPTHRQEREARYLEIIGKYQKKEQELFPQMLAYLVEALQEKIETVGTEDILGLIYHELELHNKYKGQFFTPQHVSDLMGYITFGEKGDFEGDNTKRIIEEHGFVSACEPSCGSGVMATSMCKAMEKAGYDYHKQLLLTAIDVDLKCVHMTYLQLALYGVPAVVIHGNSLTCEEFSRWYTPAYLIDGWVWRGHCGITNKFCVEDEIIKRASEPMYAIIQQIQELTAEPTRDIKTTAPDPNPAPPVREVNAENKPPVKTGQLSLFDL